MTVPSAAEAMIVTYMRTALEAWCITSVPLDDASRANHVIVGKPTRELRDEIVISVHAQHPLGPSADKDSIVMGPPREPDERPWRFPQETSGGMRSEKMIGAIQLNIREDIPADEAIFIAAAVKTRVKNAVNQSSQLRAFTDDMGTFVSRIETFESAGHAAGGGNVSLFITWIGWRAFLHTTNVRQAMEV